MRKLSYIYLMLLALFASCQDQHPQPFQSDKKVSKWDVSRQSIVLSQTQPNTTNTGFGTEPKPLCQTDTEKLKQQLLQAKQPAPYKHPIHTVASNRNIAKDVSYYQKYRARFGFPKQQATANPPSALLQMQQQKYMEQLRKLNQQHTGVTLRVKQQEMKTRIFSMNMTELTALGNP